MNNDLISRSALLDDIEDTVVISARNTKSAEMRGVHKVVDRIKAAPAVDAVEVVRCGEREKRRTTECALSYFVFDDFDVKVRFLDVPDDFYCPYGERRTDA